MARAPRLNFPDGVYHVTSRGNGRARIVYSDDDRERFERQLRDNVERIKGVRYFYSRKTVPHTFNSPLPNAAGEHIEIVDPRGNRQLTTLDSRGRAVVRVEAADTAVAATSETDYDANGNVVAVRSPRYFDSGDTLGVAFRKILANLWG